MSALDINQYEPTIQNLINEIEKNRLLDPKGMMEKGKILEDYALNHSLGELYGYTLFSQAYCLYLMNDLEQSFSYYTNAAVILIETEQWELAARSYNAMGILSAGHGNVQTAMDYYLKAEAICKEKGITQVLIFINCNIAMLYMSFHNLENCKKYLYAAIGETEKLKSENDDYERFISNTQIATLYLNLASCFCQTAEADKAIEALEMANRVGGDEDEIILVCLKMLWVQVYDLSGEFEKRDQYIGEIQEASVALDVVMDNFDDIVTYAGFLLTIDKEKEFWDILTSLENSVRSTDSVNLIRRVTELKIRYYKKKNQNREYLLATGLYYELSMKMEEEKAKSYSQSMAVRLRLEEEQRTRKAAENEAASLRIKSEIDALTGLNNRYKITCISEQKFEYCVNKRMPFAIEILDIDHFKQYNDNYGHQAGDIILQKVAGAIQSMQRHRGIFTGRYGGDEFIILYIDRTYDEVVGFMQELKDKVEELKIPHEYSPVHNLVSISQGAYYHVPEHDNTPLEYLHQADHALYHIKSLGKNNFCITQ